MHHTTNGKEAPVIETLNESTFMQLGFSSVTSFVTFLDFVSNSLVAKPFSILSLRAADKQSSDSPNELDTSLVNSQLIYFWQEIQ